MNVTALRFPLTSLATIAIGLGLTAPAAAQEDADQVEALNQRVAALEAALAKKSAKKPAKPAAKKKPFGWRVPGTKTQLTVGGYVKLDAIMMNNSTNGGNDYSTGAGAPTTNDPGEDWQFMMHARQSRLWVKTLTPTEAGPLKTFLSFDFYGEAGGAMISNPHKPRLRQAWGSLGPVLAGQTWSNFMQLFAGAASLDFTGSLGTVLIRQAQVRYTRALGEGLSFAISLENPYSTFYNQVSGEGWAPSDDRIPDVVARVDHKGTYGQASVALIGRQLRYDLDTDAADNNDTAYGFGASLAARMNLPFGNVRILAIGGTGLGRYLSVGLIQAAWVEADAAGNPTSIGGAIAGVGGNLVYEHYLTEQVSAALTLSGTTIFLPDELENTGINKNALQGIATLTYKPVAQVLLGLEYNLIRRETAAGAGSDPDLQSRIQASAKYSF